MSMYNVLLVDDEPLVRDALASIISKRPSFTVVGSIGTGSKALELSTRLKTDLVFLDIGLPDKTGLTVAEKIKQHSPNTEIVIITAYNDVCYRQQAQQLGIHNYILKPFSLPEITAVLRQHCKQDENLLCHKVYTPFTDGLTQKSFEDACQEVRSMVSDLFITQPTWQKRYLILTEILTDALEQITGLPEYYRRSYEQKFTITEALCADRALVEFWLFDLIEEVFKQNSIQLYPGLSQVFAYVDQHMEGDISLREATAKTSWSEGYLCRLFKREFGTNFAVYVNLKKIKRSKQLLKQSRLTVNDVAFGLGYNESNYFCKVFKKYEQVTPSQYREFIQQQTRAQKITIVQ